MAEKFEDYDSQEEQEDTKKNRKKELFEKLNSDMENISPALVDICNKIKEEMPDEVIFLDKSARIFALPMRKFLSSQNEQNIPPFYFYNDDSLKHKLASAVSDNPDGSDRRIITDFSDGIKERIKNEFLDLENKEVFVVDEMFANGAGARLWIEAAKVMKIKIHFFALSQKNDEIYNERLNVQGLEEFRDETLEMAENTSNFTLTIYPNDLTDLFSRYKEFQMVEDRENKQGEIETVGINKKLKDYPKTQKDIGKSGIPSPYKYISEEDVREENSMKLEFVKEAQKIIHSKMKVVEENLDN